MAIQNTDELKAEIQRLVEAWQTYSDENQVDLLADRLDTAHIQKLFELQQQIKQIEDTLIVSRVPFDRTLLMFRDTIPPALPDERQNMTRAQYEAIANQIETTFTKVWIKLGTLLQNPQYGVHRYTLAAQVGQQFQHAYDLVIQEANQQLRESLNYRIIYDPRSITTMFSLPPKPQRYPFDPSGHNPNNRVTETRNVTSKDGEHNFIIPFAAPYFVDTLKVSRVSKDGRVIPLTLNDDYLASGLFGEMSEYTLGGKLVASIILFDDSEASGEYVLEYQTLGGDYVMDSPGYAKAVANYLNTPFIKTYGEIIGRPLVLDPMRHQLHVDDLTHLGDFLPIFQDMDSSLKTLIEQNNSLTKGGNILDELEKQVGLLRDTTNDITNQFRELSNDVTRRVDGLQTNFDELENRITSNTNTAVEEIKRFTNERLAETTSNITNNLATFRSDIRQHVANEISTNNQRLSDDIRNDVNQSLERHIRSIPTRDEIENIVTNKATELIGTVPEQLTRLENNVNEQLNGQSERVGNLANRLNTIEQANLNQRLGKVESSLDGKINTAKSEVISTLRQEITDGMNAVVESTDEKLDGKVSTTDYSYVRYNGLNNKNLINTDIIQVGKNLIETDGTGAIVIPDKVKATDFLVPSPTSQPDNPQYVPVMTTVNELIGNVINQLTTVGDIARSTDRLVPKESISQGNIHQNTNSDNHDRRGKLAYVDTNGNTMIDNKLTFNHLNKYLEYNPTEDTFHLSNSLYVDDVIVTGSTSSPPVSVLGSLTDTRDAISNHNDRLNELSRADERIDNVINQIKAAIANQGRAISNIPDRVQRTSDYKRTSTMVNRAPLVQSDGTTYFGGEVILTRPSRAGGYDHTASQSANHRIKLAYEYSSTYGKTLVTDAMIVMPNFTLTSDKRLKEDIQKLDDADDIIDAIHGYRYTLSSTNQAEFGVIAQELLMVAPDLVHLSDDGYLSVKYAGLTAVLIEYVKKQNKRIHDLETRLSRLEGRINES